MSISFQSNATFGSIKSSDGITLKSGSTLSAPTNGSGRIFNVDGTVVQTVSLRYDTKSSWSYPAGPTNVIVSDLNITITPKYATSKILLTYMLSYETQYNSVFRLGRNGTEFLRNSTDGNRWSGFANPGYEPDTASTPMTNTFMYMDYFPTLSSITYNLIVSSSDSGNGILYMNRAYSSAGANDYEVGISYVIAQEIM